MSSPRPPAGSEARIAQIEHRHNSATAAWRARISSRSAGASSQPARTIRPDSVCDAFTSSNNEPGAKTNPNPLNTDDADQANSGPRRSPFPAHVPLNRLESGFIKTNCAPRHVPRVQDAIVQHPGKKCSQHEAQQRNPKPAIPVRHHSAASASTTTKKGPAVDSPIRLCA